MESLLREYTLDIIFTRDVVPKLVVERVLDEGVKVLLFIEEMHEDEDTMTVQLFHRGRKEGILPLFFHFVEETLTKGRLENVASLTCGGHD